MPVRALTDLKTEWVSGTVVTQAMVDDLIDSLNPANATASIDLTSINSAISTLQSNQATDEANISAIQSKQTTDEAAIATLNAALAIWNGPPLTGTQTFTVAGGLMTVKVTWTRHGAGTHVYISCTFTAQVTTTPLTLFTWQQLDIPGWNSASSYAHPIVGCNTYEPVNNVNNQGAGSYSTGGSFGVTDVQVTLINASACTQDTTSTLAMEIFFNDCSGVH